MRRIVGRLLLIRSKAFVRAGWGTAKKAGMSIQLLGLRTVIYPAPDIDAAKKWWTEYLGTPPYFDEPFYVGFNPGGYELGLLPDGDPVAGPLTYWGVDDVDEAVAAAIQIGAVEHLPASDVGDGIITATVTTPQGNIVGFIYNPHFELPSIAG
jgi:catechol 2,3-dioxygenase-like lactoylglutathione lyase family enzyme